MKKLQKPSASSTQPNKYIPPILPYKEKAQTEENQLIKNMKQVEKDLFSRNQNNKIQAVSLTSDNDFKIVSDDKNRDSQESNNDKNDGKLSQALIGGEIDLLIK